MGGVGGRIYRIGFADEINGLHDESTVSSCLA